MKQYKLLISVVLAGIIAAQAQTPTATPVTFAFGGKVGDTYSTNSVIKISASGADISVVQDATYSLTAVNSDGTLEFKEHTDSQKISVAGQDVPAPEQPDSTSVFNADGTLKAIKADQAPTGDVYRANNLSIFIVPKDPVKPGDSWTKDVPADKTTGAAAYTAKYTFVGTEKVGAYDAAKVTFSIKETEGDTPASSEGTMWLDPATCKIDKADAKFTNLPLPGAGAVTGTALVTRTK